METADIVLIVLGFLIVTLFAYLTGYSVAKRALWKASEERAVQIVENWITKIQAQQESHTINQNFDTEIIKWTIERAIEDEDYEEAARLSELLRKMQDGEFD